ncbi:MAG: response regulator transcription factor [Clostridiales bacterium]|nr:response regulator transcription factor [Clostridiales bacterium]
MYNILVCDDENDIVSAIRIQLEKNGYNVYEAYDGQQMLDIYSKHGDDIDLIIMDVMMPVLDGFSAISALRRSSEVPVIFLSAKGDNSDKVQGLDCGADDYISKPYNPEELIARVRARLRRPVNSQAPASHIYTNGDLEINDKEKSVSVGGKKISLTPREYDILLLFVKNLGEVFGPEEIYTAVWHEPPVAVGNTVTVHIRHLREKIEYDPSKPRFLKVIWGRGYKMEKLQ